MDGCPGGKAGRRRRLETGGLWVGVAGCRGSDRSSLLSPTAVWAGLMAYDFSLMACWKLWADSMSGRTFR